MATEGEIGTLRFVWDEASALRADAYILYYHSKGVSRTGNLAVREWRRVMEYFCVERWREAVSTLERGADMAGVNWEEVPYPHFSGNFWWARSEYVSGMQPLQRHSLIGSVEQFPSILHSPRHDAELWPGSGRPRVAQLYRTGLEPGQHYQFPHFREQYAEPDPQGKLPLAFHYYHLFLPEGAEKRGLDILKEHMCGLRSSGLAADFQCISIMVISRWAGARAEVQAIAPEAQVWQVSAGHEAATLVRIQADLGKIPDEALVFYAHSKGVSYTANGEGGIDEQRRAAAWRKTMAYFCVTRWTEAIRPLVEETCDVSGVFYLTPSVWREKCSLRGVNFGDSPYYGGNFWWARAGFLKKLPKVDLTASRYFAERWIGLVPHQAASAFHDVWPDDEAYQMILGRFAADEPMDVCEL